MLEGVAKQNEELRAEKLKLSNIPPLEEMTIELEAYYFPEKSQKFYNEVINEVDYYAKKLEDKKKGHHHH